ncbi:hypothetical protein Tco_0016354 [Tanacetum coccineum]
MSTYLKNMAGYKPNQIKNKIFDDIQKLFDKAITRVNTFIDMDTELVEGSEVRSEGSEVRAEAEIAQESSSKRAGTKLEQESIKKQKVDMDKETTELQRLIEVVFDKEKVAIDAIPLATKPPSIVDYKIHKEGKKTYYQIIKADGSLKMYLVFSHMLKSFNREDLETLWKLVKSKHGSTRPEEGYEKVLWGDLKTMFDPHVKDQVWRNQQVYRVLDWKLYDSCGVHSLRKQNVHIHMLVEKRYPLTPATITDMLNRKLQADHWNEMIKRLHDDLEVTAAKVCITAAKLKYVELYDKHRGSFIVNGHRIKLFHVKEQLNELTIEEIYLMCEEGRMKDIPFMAPFPANYHETGKGIVIENILYVPSEGSSLEKK